MKIAMKITMKSPMKNSLALAILISSYVVQPHAHAAPRDWGAGVIFGQPTGFVGKNWLEPKRAIDLGMTWAFDFGFLVYGDYLFHFPAAFKSSEKFVRELSPYVGVGAMMLFASREAKSKTNGFGADGFSIGFRFPLGIEWLPTDAPVGVFLELVPGIAFIPSVTGVFQGGLGARYYFQ